MYSQAIILDTETHTLYGCPIEIAYLPIELNHGQVDYQANQLFDGYFSLDERVEIDLAAMAVHHILPHDIQGQPHYQTFRLPHQVQYIIGHNVDYDLQAISKTGQDLRTIKPICTLALARRAWLNLPSYSLGFLSYFISNNLEHTRTQIRNAHRADTDVLLTLQLLQQLVTHYQVTSIEQLYLQSQAVRLPTVMPFGKHRGKALADVPLDYVQWLLAQDNIDVNLREAFALLSRP